MLILLPMFVKVGILVQQPFHIKSPHFAGVGVVGRPEINLSCGISFRLNPLGCPNHNLKNPTVQDFQSEFYNFYRCHPYLQIADCRKFRRTSLIPIHNIATDSVAFLFDLYSVKETQVTLL